MTFESNRLKHGTGTIRILRYDQNAIVAGSQNALCLHIPVTRLTPTWVRHLKPLHCAPREMRRNNPRCHGREAQRHRRTR